MNVRLFELFTSFEGEGIFYGTKTLFVRLAGCPFSCFYCDTPAALPIDSGTEYNIDDASDLIAKSLENNTYKVNFTGGEPLLQFEAVAELAKQIQSKGISTYLESSCYDSKKFSHVLPSFDLIKIEFKTKDSKFVDEKHFPNLLENTLNCLEQSINSKKTTFIKIVVTSKTKFDSFKEIIDEIFKIIKPDDLSGFIIQPESDSAQPDYTQLLKFYDIIYPKFKEVRIVPQLHKFVGAP